VKNKPYKVGGRRNQSKYLIMNNAEFLMLCNSPLSTVSITSTCCCCTKSRDIVKIYCISGKG
jgi:hypothetical protein